MHQNINGKAYIGLTSKTLENRWRSHCKKARADNTKNYFHRAIVKYGIDNWESEILDTCQSFAEAEGLEIKWISYFKSNQKEFGYNSTTGGNVSQSNLDDRVKSKISKAISALWNQDEYRLNMTNKMKKWHKENNNPFLGKRHSLASLEKISKAVIKWNKTHDNPFKGQKHTDESKNKMSKAAVKRCNSPGWQPPFVKNGVSESSRRKMSESAKARIRTSSYCTKDEFILIAQRCRTQKEIAIQLGCTPANVNHLLNNWNIKKYIQSILKHNKEIHK